MKIARIGLVSGRTVVKRGEILEDSDPRIALNPDAFEDVNRAAATPPVESATSRPGEKRSTKRTKKDD